MSERLLERLLAPPPKLLFREAELSEARARVERGEPFKVVGPPGVGKTTLVELALIGVSHAYVSCFQRRTARLILSSLDEARWNVLDDFSLALWDERLFNAVKQMPRVVLVELPHRRSPLLENRVIEMRPYSREQLEEIVRERVVRLLLPADDEDIRRAAEEGARRGGNARVALLALHQLILPRIAKRQPLSL
ncbi:MAG: hypothetical protein QXV98_03390 [Thermofilaceae archaeon]